MNAPTMNVTILAVGEERVGKPNWKPVFVTGKINILISANDPSYVYLMKGRELTVSYRALEVSKKDGKEYVKVVEPKIIDMRDPEVSSKANPFAHLTPAIAEDHKTISTTAPARI